jgi:hypothetical protein
VVTAHCLVDLCLPVGRVKGMVVDKGLTEADIITQIATEVGKEVIAGV